MINFLDNLISNDYLRAFIYFIIYSVILRSLIYVAEKIILKMTVKTKTDLDDKILEKTSKPLTFLALLVSLKISLGEFSLTEQVNTALSNAVHSLIIVVVALLIYVIFSLSFSRAWRKVAKKTKSGENEGLRGLIEGAMKILLILGTIIYILSSWGIEIGPLLAGIGIGGIAIAFALQSSLSNVFGGVSLILDKTVRIGDLISLPDGTTGTVIKVGIRSTQIRNFDNEIIFYPNSKLADGKIQNIALPEPKVRVVIPFGVAYGTKIERVKKIVLKEIKSIKGVLSDPEPTVKFLKMADSSLDFKAFFFVDSFENRFGAIDEANTKIYNALNKNKISIPFPQMDVYIKK